MNAHGDERAPRASPAPAHSVRAKAVLLCRNGATGSERMRCVVPSMLHHLLEMVGRRPPQTVFLIVFSYVPAKISTHTSTPDEG